MRTVAKQAFLSIDYLRCGDCFISTQIDYFLFQYTLFWHKRKAGKSADCRAYIPKISAMRLPCSNGFRQVPENHIKYVSFQGTGTEK
jgi:hypothetical protein